MEEKKKLWPILLKIILALVVFEVVMELAVTFTGNTIWQTLFKGKYTKSFVAESIALISALGLLLVSKTLNILKTKRLDFKESISLGMPMLIITVVLLASNITNLSFNSLNWYNLISLTIYTFAIGFFEEVLYRGFVLKKLTNNYGDTRKRVIISIIISALIFGMVHITNLFVGQDILTTIAQVIQTFGLGILLGSVYYVSDNIWSVIFLHGFYDFAAMLSDVNLIKDCGYIGNVPLSVTIHSVIVSLILSIIYILYSVSILKKSNINKALKKEVTEEIIAEDRKKENKITTLIWLFVGILFAFNFVYGLLIDTDDSDYYKCYTYEERSLEKYETHYYNYNNYNFSILNENKEIKFSIYIDDDQIVLQADNKTTSLNIKDPYRIAVIDNKIMIIATDNINYKLYYSDYLVREDIDFDNVLDNIKKSFIEFDIPDTSNLGYIVDGKNKKYLMIESDIKDYFIIDQNKLYLVK